MCGMRSQRDNIPPASHLFKIPSRETGNAEENRWQMPPIPTGAFRYGSRQGNPDGFPTRHWDMHQGVGRILTNAKQHKKHRNNKSRNGTEPKKIQPLM